LFEPEVGPTEDIVAPRVTEAQVEQNQEMIDFLSGRSLLVEQMPDRAPITSDQVLEQVMPEVTVSQAAAQDGEAVPEFRPLVQEAQTEQNAQASQERMAVSDSQVRQNLTAAKAVLFEEVVAEQNNAPVQNAAHNNPSAYISQMVARVEVPAAEAAPSPAAVAAASEAEGVPGVRSAQAAEGAPTLRQEAVRVNQAEIIERIVRLTKAGVNKGRQEVRLVLNPPELGGMKVHLKIEHGTLDATIRTDTANAHQLVSANLAELRNGLIEAGLDVGFIEVLLTGEEAHSGHYSSFEEHLNEHGAGTDSRVASVAASDREPALAAAPSLNGMSLIDITV
jgi:flagellar hook-length control protein FliK